MDQLPMALESENKSEKVKLGEVPINREAFELDLKINEGYQNYSAELLRLALLILGGLGIIWTKLYLVADEHRPSSFTSIPFALAFVSAAFAAGAALLHRYTAADSLAYHLTAVRRRARNRPATPVCPSDVELAVKQDSKRNRLFKYSERLLLSSVICLFSGLLFFCVSMASLMF